MTDSTLLFEQPLSNLFKKQLFWITWLPLPVFVGRSSSIPDEGATSVGPSVVSASRRVCAMFSITDPGFMSAKFGFLAAFAFRARFLSA